MSKLNIYYRLPIELKEIIDNFIFQNHTSICSECCNYQEWRHFSDKMVHCFLCENKLCNFHSSEASFYAKKIYKQNFSDKRYLCQECYFFESNI